MPEDLTLRPAGPDDRAFVERLLAGNELPVSDLSGSLDPLYVCETDDGRVGVCGLERHGEFGLLRSVAVAESAQGNGHGTDACERLLDRARAADLTAVYLLTTTAEDFFARLGFEAVDRDDVPGPVRATSEFADLCPASAVVMKRDLDGSGDPTG